MANQAWMVRAGRRGDQAQDCWDNNCVAIGWSHPELCSQKTLEDFETLLRSDREERNEKKLSMATGQCYRFVVEFQIDDWAVTYNNSERLYYIGKITGPCERKPGLIQGLPHIRAVKWLYKTERDRLTAEARGSLSALMTVFKIAPNVIEELVAKAQGSSPPGPVIVEPTPITDNVEQVRLDSAERARNFIADRVVRLDWEEMQELVAGLLRAMGFKTRVSQPGPDRGCDILASPDGLGLSPPRIIVEVKHRPNQQMGSSEIRSFLGGRRPGDNGLYVSTGGFSKEARYEADRANIPLTLLDVEGLVDLLVQHYPNLDAEARALLPLIPVYWPVE